MKKIQYYCIYLIDFIKELLCKNRCKLHFN